MAISDLLHPQGRIDTIAHALTGPLEQGVETYHLSLYDLYQQKRGGKDMLAREGMGYSLLKSLNEGGLQVALNTPVRSINWYSPNIVVTTDVGPVNTRGVILTVPPILIAGKKIRFEPGLPAEKWVAAKSLPMGLVDKVTFQFDKNYMSGVKPNTVALIQNGASGPVWEFHLRPLGVELAIGYIGGRAAKILNQQTPQDVKRAALGALMSAFGADLRNHVKASHYTNWLADPWAHGSFTVSQIGANYSRTQFARPASKRLFFAGEACSIEWSGQAAGAYMTGIEAAKKLMSTVKL
jgi:monoamine oxidase